MTDSADACGLKQRFPKSWWIPHGEAPPDEADEHMKEAILNDRSALTVFAALLMTVNFAIYPAMNPPSFNAENTRNYEVQLFCCFAFGLGTGSSLCTIFVGCWHYLTVIKFKKNIHAAVQACENTPSLFMPVTQIWFGVIATCAGSLAIMYLNQGWKPMVCALCPMAFFVIMALYYGSKALLEADGLAYGKGAAVKGLTAFLSGKGGSMAIEEHMRSSV